MIHSSINILRDLFSSHSNYSFLVGAGISIDPPSNLPSARELRRILLEAFIPPNEINEILILKNLKLERLIGDIQRFFDKSLKCLDFFEHIKEPNLIHIFLAHMILKGYYVATTNFDYLIEYALMQLLPKYDYRKIVVVITKRDFLKFQNPMDVLNTGRFPLYKLHGSKRNIFLNKETTKFLVATLQDLGKDREPGETFAFETYKKPAIRNIMNGRCLVVLGYSGTDDFDIGPTLEELKDLHGLIWIEHSEDKKKVISRTISPNTLNDIRDDGVLRLLTNIASKSDFEVIHIRVNTQELIKRILWMEFLPEISPVDLKITNINQNRTDIQSRIQIKFPNISRIHKYTIAGKIFYDLGHVETALRCSKKCLELYRDEDSIYTKDIYLAYIALSYYRLGDRLMALDYFKEALEICDETKDPGQKAFLLNRLGFVYMGLGNFELALEYMNKSVILYQKLEILAGIAFNYGNLGYIHLIKGEFEKSLKYHEEALLLSEKRNSLFGKAHGLNNLGLFYYLKDDYKKSIECLEESLKISNSLGINSERASALHNIGRVFLKLGKFEQALKNFKKALEIYESLNRLSGIASVSNSIGNYYYEMGDYKSAFNNLNITFNINQKIGGRGENRGVIHSMGKVHFKKGEYNLALKNFKEALKFNKQLSLLPGEALNLYWIGKTYANKGQFKKALQFGKLAMEIYQKIDLTKKIEILKEDISKWMNKR